MCSCPVYVIVFSGADDWDFCSIQLIERFYDPLAGRIFVSLDIA